MLKNHSWQPVPGTKVSEIYPLMRKPDVSSSNAYILRTPSEIILIDTGADPEQMDQIVGVVSDLILEKQRPIFLFLTHCHIDHCYQALADTRLRGLGNITIAIHEYGARALESTDKEATVAEIFKWDAPSFHVDMPLFTAGDDADTSHQIQDPENGTVALKYLKMRLGTGDDLVIYHTPGHSPDSICIRVGDILFIGDLLFSTSPGIAGLAGWNPDDLAHSLTAVRRMIEHDGISVCCSGHGRSTSAVDARRALAGMESHLSSLDPVPRFDPARLDESFGYAVDLLDEANRIFSVIAGRLYTLSYHLEELGEHEEARKYQDLIEADRIDEFLAEFGRFTRQFHTGKKIELQVVLKAVQLIQKIGSLFSQDRLEHVIDLSLLRRADCLLVDFMNTVWGYQDNEGVETVDAGALIRSVLDEVQALPCSDEEFLDAADDEIAFRAALVARLAHHPLFEDVSVIISGSDDPAPLNTNPVRLRDAIIGVAEDLVSAGADTMQLSHTSRGDEIEIAITGSGGRMPADFGDAKKRSYRRRFAHCGAEIAIREEAGQISVLMIFPGV